MGLNLIDQEPDGLAIEIERVNDRFCLVGFDTYGGLRGCIKQQLGQVGGYEDPVDALLQYWLLTDPRTLLFGTRYTPEILDGVRRAMREQLYGDSEAGKTLRAKLQLGN